MGLFPEPLNLSEFDGHTRKELFAEIESLRQQLAAAQEDTIRLDFMQAFGGEHLCLLGSAFYYRAGFGQPHAKANTLRDAIDKAIKLVEQRK